MAVLWLRRLVVDLILWRPWFASGSVHVGFVVDKVAPGQVFLRVIRILLPISFHCGSLFPCIMWGMSNRHVGGRISERHSLSRSTRATTSYYIISILCFSHTAYGTNQSRCIYSDKFPNSFKHRNVGSQLSLRLC
jgi:hypothetical protein